MGRSRCPEAQRCQLALGSSPHQRDQQSKTLMAKAKATCYWNLLDYCTANPLSSHVIILQAETPRQQ